MKKLLHYADCLMLLAAIIGCALRLWFGEAGLDSKGLFRPSHPAWILLCLLSLGVVVFNYFVTRPSGDDHRYSINYPRSIVAAAGNFLLAIALGYSGIMDLLEADGFMDIVAAFACMVSAVCLGVAGVERFCGNQPLLFVHMIPCAYFTLRLCLMGRQLGTDPEVCSFLFQFLASVMMIPAMFWRWSFDVGMGNRRKALFFSLCGLYFCLVTTFEVSTGWMLYLLFGGYFLTNLCPLRCLMAPAQEEQIPAEVTEQGENAEAAPEEPVQDVRVVETEETGAAAQEPLETAEAPQEIPAQEPKKQEKVVLHGDIDPEADMEAFLSDIKRFLEDQED